MTDSTNSTNNNGLSSNYYWPDQTKAQAAANDKSAASKGQLTQKDFFSLLTEQLSNQDPTKPVNNDQMIAQMTQFTMADSLSKLNDKFDSFSTSMTSNQALQASSLIGQNVLVQGGTGLLQQGGNMTGSIISGEATHDMKITITNASGETVRTMPVGSHAAGNLAFGWDGTDQSGNALPAGKYTVAAQATVGGKSTNLPIALNRHVNSVSLASSNKGIILNLQGDDSVKLSDVLQIGS